MSGGRMSVARGTCNDCPQERPLRKNAWHSPKKRLARPGGTTRRKDSRKSAWHGPGSAREEKAPGTARRQDSRKNAWHGPGAGLSAKHLAWPGKKKHPARLGIARLLPLESGGRQLRARARPHPGDQRSPGNPNPRDGARCPRNPDRPDSPARCSARDADSRTSCARSPPSPSGRAAWC